MPELRCSTGRAPALISAFLLTMSVALSGCGTPAGALAESADQAPLGDWWPATASVAPTVAGRTAQAQPATADMALGDWWPSEAEPRSPTTLRAAARGGRPISTLGNGD